MNTRKGLQETDIEKKSSSRVLLNHLNPSILVLSKLNKRDIKINATYAPSLVRPQK